MDHVAIMKKSWKLLPKILSGDKTIESRWYSTKKAPWNAIKEGDTIYFKNAGEPVKVKAEVKKVLQFERYTEKQAKELVQKYGGKGKICFSSLDNSIRYVKERKYGILMFLKNVESIESFEIDKKGFGNACAWLCVKHIDAVKAIS